MVSKLHPLCEHANCGCDFRRKALDGEQQLVLLPVQAILPGSFFAECKKCAYLIAELGERAVILRIHLKGLYIAVRCLSNSFRRQDGRRGSLKLSQTQHVSIGIVEPRHTS